MSHGPAHHIEHAEHASHAAHDEFNKRVTISITAVAAVLAAVTMLGHRSHNETLNSLNQAVLKQNEASDKWSEYQAYNLRKHFYQTTLESSVGVPGREHAVQRWLDQTIKYQTTNLPKTFNEARRFEEERKAKRAESEAEHHRALRIDLGELGLQFGLVLCTLAILTKSYRFWFFGLGCAGFGLVVALSAFLMGHDSGHSHQPHAADEKKLGIIDEETMRLIAEFKKEYPNLKVNAP